MGSIKFSLVSEGLLRTLGRNEGRRVSCLRLGSGAGPLLTFTLGIALAASVPAADIDTVVRETLAEQLRISIEAVTDAARLVDLGGDGLDIVEARIVLEEILNVRLSDQQWHRLVLASGRPFQLPAVRSDATVADVVDVFKEAVATASRVAPAPEEPRPVARAQAPQQQRRLPGTATRARPRPRPVPPGSEAPAIRTPALPDGSDDPTYREAMQEYYAAIRESNRADQATFAALAAYDAWALENRKHIIQRQQTASMIVLAVAVFLVLGGVAFSGVQFYISMRYALRGEHVPSTTLKASLGSIEVSSSVLGVIVLVISLLFFYLYLDRVFSLAVLPD